jgi:hypothetical protein
MFDRAVAGAGFNRHISGFDPRPLHLAEYNWSSAQLTQAKYKQWERDLKSRALAFIIASISRSYKPKYA